MTAARDVTRTVTTIEYRTYPSNQHAPWAARKFLRSQLLLWGIPELTDTAELVMSELVTNAVIHARGNFVGVRLECTGSSVLIRILDENPEAVPKPPQGSPDDLDSFGRGLALVAAVCERWGWYRTADGHKVLTALITRAL